MRNSVIFKYGRYAIAIPALLMAVACSSVGQTDSAAKRQQLDDEAHAALNTLMASTPQAKSLQARSTAILVFPKILKAGLLVGGSSGDGVMMSPDGKTLGYYNTSSASWGLQAGAQDFSQVMFLTTPAAVDYLRKSDGWSIGVGPSVVVVDEGAAKSLTTTTLKSDVYAFIFGQKGLMAGLGVQGQKITHLQP